MRRIEDHALIGDGRTGALVARDGAITWLCWPRFDSPACLAAILGSDEHGAWRIAPVAPARVTRRYLPDTLVLETLFETETGSVALLDLMAIGQPAVVRILEGRSGRVPVRLDLTLRCQYGLVTPWVTRLPAGDGIHAIAGPDQMTLWSDIPLSGADMRTMGSATIQAGERLRFVLAHAPSHLPAPTRLDAEAALHQALSHWRGWLGTGDPAAPWAEPVRRSLLVLKALSHAETGGMVAAPTTSLPERIGGPRNWDYRFCWLRDSALALRALIRAGYSDPCASWAAWLWRAVAGSADRMRTLYGLGGEHQTVEWEVPWLPGHAGSTPVRVGNAAGGQRQLDVYGEVLDALCLTIEAGLTPVATAWPLARSLLAHLARIWDEPDEGIWEVRGPSRHFTLSKVMAWVAFDRAIDLAERLGLPADLAGWRTLRERIRDTVLTRGYDPGLGCFTQSFGAPVLDASLLLLPAYGFLPAGDPRMRRTIEAIGRDLSVDGFIRRYHTDQAADGLAGDEGVFLACSFWYVDALAALGRWEEAAALFRRLLAVANDVGLLAEEYDPVERRLLGNFPQGFSHLALIQSALTLRQAPV